MNIADAKAKTKLMEIDQTHLAGKPFCVYEDSRSISTVGIGHKVGPSQSAVIAGVIVSLKAGDCITEKQAEQLFEQDFAVALAAATSQANDANSTDEKLIAALVMVNYQLGIHWTDKFPDTWTAIRAGNYPEAIQNVQNSAWHQQTPERVADFDSALQDIDPSLFNAPRKLAWGEALLYAKQSAKNAGIDDDDDVVNALASVILFHGRNWNDTTDFRQIWRDMANKDYRSARNDIYRTAGAKQYPAKARDFAQAMGNLERDKAMAVLKARDIANILRSQDRSWNDTDFARAIAKARYGDAARILAANPPASTLRAYQDTLSSLN